MKKHVLALALSLALLCATLPAAQAQSMIKPANLGQAVICTSDGVTAMIAPDNTLWMWGKNYYGELGSDIYGEFSTPTKMMDGVDAVSLTFGRVAAIKTDGSLWMWGQNEYGQLGNGTTEDTSTPIQVMNA